MAANLTDYLENELLDHINGVGAFTMPAGVYLALITADPTDAGLMTNELPATNGYSRQAITFGAASGGAAANTGVVSFTASGGAWAQVTHVLITDNATQGAGNALWQGAMTTPRTVGDGDTLTFAIGDIDVALT